LVAAVLALTAGLLLLLVGGADHGARERVVRASNPAIAGRMVAYHPSGQSASSRGQPVAQREHIERDLAALRRAGFNGLVTYAAVGDALGAVPRIAREAGFDGTIVMGLWDPESEAEWAHALAQAAYVDGYCIGNEGLGLRYPPDVLARRMEQLRAATGKPVTTSEPIDLYLRGPYREWLLAHSDWLFPIAHPYWADQMQPEAAIDWLVAHRDLLVAQSGRAVLLKEAGVPTAGVPGYGEGAQVRFFELLDALRLPVVHFEAFDQPWKAVERGHPAEGHWGLFRSDGSPKPIVSWLAVKGGER
jgi:exo-beta-1,3-glucanase (GH17 family)